METTKTKFQALLSEIESLLEDLKNAYPKNYSEKIQRCVWFMVLIAAVFLLINIIFASSYGIYLLYCIVYAPLIVLPLYLIYQKFNKGDVKYADSSELEKKIRAAKDEFGEYPDVVNYLDKTYEGVQTINAKKNRITSVVVTISFVLILTATIFTLVRVNNYERWDSIDNFKAVLGTNSNKPLVRILPFKTEVTDSIQLPTDRLNIFGFYDLFYNGLSIETPNFIYADGYNPENDLYLLTITDLNGNPVPKCPDFYFESLRSERVEVITWFNQNSNGYYYEALRLFLSIKENQDSLRFVVEKM
ncbi:MAG: hypothetical protein J6Z01_12785 [Bacteroidales bacterium]|nr:hypothetical protein [Bacteroidales bacterium]